MENETMGKYRNVNTDFWADGYVETLKPKEKLLFLYLLTCPNGNLAGCYQVNIRYVEVDTGVDKEEILNIFQKFQDDGKIVFKDNWICVKNFIKHQQLSNYKIKNAIFKQLEKVPDFLLSHIDRLSIGYPLSMDRSNDNDNDSDNENDNENKELKEKKIKKEKIKDNTSAPVKNPVAIWCEKFKAKFGNQYIITPKDAGHLNRVYKLIPEQFESKIDAFFESDNWAHEWNVSIFQATLNKTKKQEPKIKYGKDY